MSTGSPAEFFEREGMVLAFLGVRGDQGVFVFRQEGGREWSFCPVNSILWDTYHQETYRNFKSDPVKSEEIENRLPPLPPVPEVTHVEWENQFTQVKDRSILREGRLFSRVRNAPDQTLIAYYVLVEDPYESSFGDGVFRYFSAAFLSAEEARAHAAAREREGNRVYVKQATAVLQGKELAFPDFRPGMYEHASLEEIVKWLNRRV